MSQHGLFSDYANDQMCWDGDPQSRNYSCIQTIGGALSLANKGGATRVEPGVSIVGGSTAGVASALAAVRWSDVVVLAVGTDVISVEHEGIDRSSVGLPHDSHQQAFAAQVLATAGQAGVPVVLILCNGGAVCGLEYDRFSKCKRGGCLRL